MKARQGTALAQNAQAKDRQAGNRRTAKEERLQQFRAACQRTTNPP